MPATATAYYERPGFFTTHVFNRLVRWSTQVGLPLWGSRVLRVEGRTSGVIRETVVNVLTLDGVDYLVAPRGNTQWVRNLRAAERGAIRVGRKQWAFHAIELHDADARAAVIRPYLARWAFEVGQFFDGVGPDSSDEELAAIAHCHPVFRLVDAHRSSAALSPQGCHR